VGVRAVLMILVLRLAWPAWAVFAELAWHLAGQAWAFAVLAAGLAWVAARLPAAVAAASSKAYAVETRVDGLVPVVHGALTTANSAQADANTALSIIPGNHGFLGGLSSMFAGSSSTGGSAGGAPGLESYYEADAPASYSQGTQQAYVNHHNFLCDDVRHIRDTLNSLVSSYNSTINCVQYLQGELHTHGYSSN
jgi:hypothetical protein